MVKGKGKNELGRALNKDRNKRAIRRKEGTRDRKPVSQNELTSVLESNSLDEFIANAKMASQVFSDRQSQFVVLDSEGLSLELSGRKVPNFNFQQLKVPRRPEWNEEMTAEELDIREKEAFLEWRREIAIMENSNQNLKVTPFEKNLQVWRQLWRVLERSDIIVQIVDARNPLFYHSEDLNAYASEVNKPVLIIVNKSDFLTDFQREKWANYLKEKGWNFLFFSAHLEQVKLNEIERRKRGNIDEALDDSATNSTKGPHVPGSSGITTREQLIKYFETFSKKHKIKGSERNAGRICIGMVGYPNVGKSSCINVILGVTPFSHGSVRVSVAATPGKTKHFQTLVLSPKLMLCDCPGLVFPSFVTSYADMICAGVLPINQMRDYVAPIALVCRRIPRHVLEATYAISLPLPKDLLEDVNEESNKYTQTQLIPTTTNQLLSAFCLKRGFMTAGSGRPDNARGSRLILIDYVSGLLLFCHPPPNLNIEEQKTFHEQTELSAFHSEKLRKRLERMLQAAIKLQEKKKVQNSDEDEEDESAEEKSDEDVEEEEVEGNGDDDDKEEEEDGEDDKEGKDKEKGSDNEEEEDSEEGDSEEEDSDDDKEEEEESEESKRKRDRKIAKRWGKKNKKFRDKRPYDEEKGYDEEDEELKEQQMRIAKLKLASKNKK